MQRQRRWNSASRSHLILVGREENEMDVTSTAYRSLAHSKAGGGLMNVETVEHRSRSIRPAALQLPHA